MIQKSILNSVTVYFPICKTVLKTEPPTQACFKNEMQLYVKMQEEPLIQSKHSIYISSCYFKMQLII